ncbi:E3 ubiquitin-protein ligase At3g02290-like [Mercurialis annua]|uniref:E3 ubiquitin-protein ligase At3g02290-like n=1 Tax=Mercurialis annua TaxID=3986 RepID=UPI00215FBC8A|nr:E3 ubiquitin-protein ligase At3g02290-like [Mercurialis annua]
MGLVFFFLICCLTIFICLRHRTSNTQNDEHNELEHVHRDIENDAAERRNIEERRERTLTLIQLFKKVVYSKNNKVSSTGEEDDDVCPICIEKFNDDNECVVLPCSHMFHKLCLQNWLNKNTLCPIRRAAKLEIHLANQV